MKLKAHRLILFVKDMPIMIAFYRDVLGFKVREKSDGWADLDAGGFAIALHEGAKLGQSKRASKIVFYTAKVEDARAELMTRGVKMGKVVVFGKLNFCDGRDPEGNIFQISNRP